MKKAIFTILAAMMAAVVAVSTAGCGSQQEESQTEPTTIPKATNATSAPTQPATRFGSTTTATAPTRPTSMTEATSATEEQEETEAETQAAQGGDTGTIADAAMSYFSVSSDVGASADIVGTETAPDGTLFYNVYVYYSGNTYPIYVSADGSTALEPEYFFTTYSGGGGSAGAEVTEAVTDAQVSYDYGADSEYNVVEPYAGY